MNAILRGIRDGVRRLRNTPSQQEEHSEVSVKNGTIRHECEKCGAFELQIAERVQAAMASLPQDQAEKLLVMAGMELSKSLTPLYKALVRSAEKLHVLPEALGSDLREAGVDPVEATFYRLLSEIKPEAELALRMLGLDPVSMDPMRSAGSTMAGSSPFWDMSSIPGEGDPEPLGALLRSMSPGGFRVVTLGEEGGLEDLMERMMSLGSRGNESDPYGPGIQIRVIRGEGIGIPCNDPKCSMCHPETAGP